MYASPFYFRYHFTNPSHLVSIVLCVWTIFWGIPLALRAIARCFALIRYRWSTQMDGYDAVEKGIGYYGNEKDGEFRLGSHCTHSLTRRIS